jgi:hypothetical protein
MLLLAAGAWQQGSLALVSAQGQLGVLKFRRGSWQGLMHTPSSFQCSYMRAPPLSCTQVHNHTEALISKVCGSMIRIAWHAWLAVNFSIRPRQPMLSDEIYNMGGPQVIHGHTGHTGGDNTAGVSTGASPAEKDATTGESTVSVNCTLREVVDILFGHVPRHAQHRIASQMLPAWMAALKTHDPEGVCVKAVGSGTMYKWRRALPMAVAVQVVEAQRQAALAVLEAEVDGLRSALDAIAAAQAAPPPAGTVHDVFSDDEQ